jgi:hypothetical protein
MISPVVLGVTVTVTQGWTVGTSGLKSLSFSLCLSSVSRRQTQGRLGEGVGIGLHSYVQCSPWYITRVGAVQHISGSNRNNTSSKDTGTQKCVVSPDPWSRRLDSIQCTTSTAVPIQRCLWRHERLLLFHLGSIRQPFVKQLRR